MLNLLIVAIGGAIGASLRHLMNVAAMRLVGPNFPWGTMAINIVGCLAMGLFIGALGRRIDAPNELRLFVATGVLGGFTTFSAFSLDFAVLWERDLAGGAIFYAAATVVGSLCAVFGGLALARSLG